MTRKYAKQLNDDRQACREVIIQSTMAIFTIARSSKCGDVPAFLDSFGQRLTTIIQLAFEVKAAIAEGVLTGDMKLLTVPAGMTFDATTMEDTYADNNRPAQTGGKDQVLCTTDLGLELHTLDAHGKPEISPLLTPKVALSSVLEGF